VEVMLFHAHSGLRYLVLLAGIVALVSLLQGRFGGRPYGRADRLTGAAFTGLLDVQVLLGVITVFVRPWFPALIGHIVMMVLALAVAHGLGIASRRANTESRRYSQALLAVVLPLLLIIGGVTAIGRSLV